MRLYCVPAFMRQSALWENEIHEIPRGGCLAPTRKHGEECIFGYYVSLKMKITNENSACLEYKGWCAYASAIDQRLRRGAFFPTQVCIPLSETVQGVSEGEPLCTCDTDRSRAAGEKEYPIYRLLD